MCCTQSTISELWLRACVHRQVEVVAQPSVGGLPLLAAFETALEAFEAELVLGRAMNAREDPQFFPCCTAYPRPPDGRRPPNDCRCG